VLRYRGKPLVSLITFRQLVESVAALHEENIFHRDIKPANIFIGNDGSPILGDFGIAFLPDLPERLTFTNESVGSRDYMPPWAETGERLEKVSGPFDVYMLGKLLWCMVAGRLKLIREWYTKPDFNLTVIFQGDPQMHMINDILEKCLHDSPERCLPQAGELLLVVDGHLNVMRRGGQMLRDGVPRPCRVCGNGFYKAEGPGRRQAGIQLLDDNRVHTGTIFFRPFVCDYCQHVEFFKVSN